MGPVRRRLTAGALVATASPGAAWADVCGAARPFWDATGGAATMVDEALHFAATPLSGVLIVATLAALRFRSAWGGLVAVCGWSGLVGLIAFADAPALTGISDATRAEGCIGSPALFIGVVTAICIATILYTAPSEGRSDKQE